MWVEHDRTYSDAVTRQQEVTVRVPAKVNLQLAVGGPCDDGYHEIATIFQAVSLHDEVVAAHGDGLTLTIDGESTDGVPADGTNLAVRAAVLLATHAGVPADVALTLHKSIPVAGGMAGGSADAAATLLACDALWGTDLDRVELMALAAELGSDVPFGLVGGTAVGLGRGDRVTPALTRGTFEWVFAVSDEGLSTPAVYAECDRLRAGRVLPEPRPSERVMAALRAADPELLGRALGNDLQPAACSLRPSLRMTLEVGEEYGALGSIVSGSGPTCAFLVRDTEHALDLAVALTASGTARTVRRAHGPVAGARIVEGPTR